MKRTIFAIVCILILSLCVGCTPKQKPSVNPPANQVQVNPQVNQTPADTSAKGYTIVKSSDLPKDVDTWFKSFDTKKGAYVYQHPDYTYLRVIPGGSAVRVRDFVNGEYDKTLSVDYTADNKNEGIILKIGSQYISNYKVTANNVPLKVEQKVVNASFELPKENDVMSNPVRVKGKAAVFEGAFIVRVIDANGKIIKEEHLQTAGAPAWGAFDSQIQYGTVTTAKGRLEIGEYSAKDGSYIMHAKVDVKLKK